MQQKVHTECGTKSWDLGRQSRNPRSCCSKTMSRPINNRPISTIDSRRHNVHQLKVMSSKSKIRTEFLGIRPGNPRSPRKNVWCLMAYHSHTIGHVWWDHNLSSFTDTKLGDTSIEARDDLLATKFEFKWLTSISRRVKHVAARELREMHWT